MFDTGINYKFLNQNIYIPYCILRNLYDVHLYKGCSSNNKWSLMNHFCSLFDFDVWYTLHIQICLLYLIPKQSMMKLHPSALVMLAAWITPNQSLLLYNGNCLTHWHMWLCTAVYSKYAILISKDEFTCFLQDLSLECS